MSKEKAKYVQNQLVNVKGRKAPARIHWPTMTQIPTINQGEFVLQQRMMYKLNDGTYAWEDDLTAAKK